MQGSPFIEHPRYVSGQPVCTTEFEAAPDAAIIEPAVQKQRSRPFRGGPYHLNVTCTAAISAGSLDRGSYVAPINKPNRGPSRIRPSRIACEGLK